MLEEQRTLDGWKGPDLDGETKITCKNCSTLTFRGTEKFAVRMMASAIAWAYQGCKKEKKKSEHKRAKALHQHVCSRNRNRNNII